MASSVDIAPSVGHAPLATQLGVGASPGYDMIDLRRLVQAGVHEGVHDVTGWKVSEHSPPGLSVDVLSAVGLATVQGDSLLQQGLYVVPPHASTPINLTIGTPHASLPRFDQVLLHVYDDSLDGSGLNKVALEMVAGTPTGGATIDNRIGAAARPPSALLLADILVRPSSTTVLNSDMRDRRPWANGAYSTIVYTGADLTSSSTPAVQMSSSLRQRIECSGAPVRMTLRATLNVPSGGAVRLIPWMDGAAIASANGPVTYQSQTVGSQAQPASAWQWDLLNTPAGSHLFVPAWSSTGGQLITAYSATLSGITVTVEEILVATGNNGTT